MSDVEWPIPIRPEFDRDADPNDPRRPYHRAMHNEYGRDPERRCEGCQHLIVIPVSAVSYNSHVRYWCELSRNRDVPRPLWWRGWEACGRFDEAEVNDA